MEVSHGPEGIYPAVLRAKFHVTRAVSRWPHPSRTGVVPRPAMHVYWVHRLAYEPGRRLLDPDPHQRAAPALGTRLGGTVPSYPGPAYGHWLWLHGGVGRGIPAAGCVGATGLCGSGTE